MPRLRSHRAKERADEPSTSKQRDPQPPADRSEAKTPEKADHNAKTPEPRPDSPENCSICLSNVENKAFTDSCFHTFCYVCLLEWSKVKAVCPLCKQAFKKIIYNVRSLDDFDEFVIPPAPPLRDHLWENQNHHFWAVQAENARFRYRTTLTHDRLDVTRRQRHPAGVYERSLGAPGVRRVDENRRRRRRAEAALWRRRRVYDDDMWVLPVSPTSDPTELAGYDSRYRETSPEFFSANEACRYALIPWLSRELNILLHESEENVHFVLELILDLIQRFEIRSDEFYELVHPFLARHTRHFVHEFYHFARSPYDLNTYDQRATYENRPNGALATDGSGSGAGRTSREDSESDGDDVMVVDVESANPPETLSEVLSRSSGVPLANIGPINVEWSFSSTLGDVRAFLQNVTTSASFGIGSGASQMARIQSHHNYAFSSRDDDAATNEPIDLSQNTETEATVTLPDTESDDDVIFVKYEKPYAERTPIVLSSGSDDDLVEREVVKQERKKRSRHGSGRRGREDRRNRSGSRSRSRGRVSRSKDRRGGSSRDWKRKDGHSSDRRHSRSYDRHRDRRRTLSRSRSRDRRRSSSHDRFDLGRRRYRASRSPGRRRSRSPDRRRSRSPDRRRSRSPERRRSRSPERRRSRSPERSSYHRSRDARRRYSSSDSVEITKVRRRKAKKHKNKHRKKHKKHHKRRRVSSSSERPKPERSEEPSTSSESRKYKKHPTGHKSSKRQKMDNSTSEQTSSAERECKTSESGGTETLVSSGFESGEPGGESPIDVTTVSSDVTTVSNDVTAVSDNVTTVSSDVTAVSDNVTTVSNDVTAVSDNVTTVSNVTAMSDDVTSTINKDMSDLSVVEYQSNASLTASFDMVDMVRDIVNDLVSNVTSNADSSGDKSLLMNCASDLDVPPPERDVVVANASIETPSSDWLGLDSKLLDENWPFNASKITDQSSNEGVTRKLPSISEFVDSRKEFQLPKLRTENSAEVNDQETASNEINIGSDSDCIIDTDDDVVFEGECRCRARQKCAKCLKSDTSSSSSDSESDSSDASVQETSRDVRTSDDVTTSPDQSSRRQRCDIDRGLIRHRRELREASRSHSNASGRHSNSGGRHSASGRHGNASGRHSNASSRQSNASSRHGSVNSCHSDGSCHDNQKNNHVLDIDSDDTIIDVVTTTEIRDEIDVENRALSDQKSIDREPRTSPSQSPINVVTVEKSDLNSNGIELNESADMSVIEPPSSPCSASSSVDVEEIDMELLDNSVSTVQDTSCSRTCERSRTKSGDCTITSVEDHSSVSDCLSTLPKTFTELMDAVPDFSNDTLLDTFTQEAIIDVLAVSPVMLDTLENPSESNGVSSVGNSSSSNDRTLDQVFDTPNISSPKSPDFDIDVVESIVDEVISEPILDVTGAMGAETSVFDSVI